MTRYVTIFSVSLNCTFENNTLCEGWMQDMGDIWDWTLTEGDTLTENSGPTSGHSTGNFHSQKCIVKFKDSLI